MVVLAAPSNVVIDQAMAAALVALSATATLANVAGTMASSTATTTTRDASTRDQVDEHNAPRGMVGREPSPQVTQVVRASCGTTAGASCGSHKEGRRDHRQHHLPDSRPRGIENVRRRSIGEVGN